MQLDSHNSIYAGACTRYFRRELCELWMMSNVIPADVAVPGRPPTPVAIMQGILTAISSVQGSEAALGRGGANDSAHLAGSLGIVC